MIDEESGGNKYTRGRRSEMEGIRRSKNRRFRFVPPMVRAQKLQGFSILAAKKRIYAGCSRRKAYFTQITD